MEERPIYFESALDLHTWFLEHCDQAQELWIGFYKKASGQASLSYAEAADEALCFGWAEAIRRSVDADRYAMRWTPRKPHSIWSARNLARFEELLAAGLVHERGIRVHAERDLSRSGAYSYERDHAALPAEMLQALQDDPHAWHYWESMPPSYRKTATWWVIRAKQEATRERRFDHLLDCCAEGIKIKPLRSKADG